MKYNQATLTKVEKMLTDADYVLRYERGTFQSGYCILEDKKVVVLNKFLQLEGRLNTLMDIVPQLKIDPDQLPSESKATFDQVQRELSAKQE